MDLKRLKSLVGASAAVVSTQGVAEAVWDSTCSSCVSGCESCSSCSNCSSSCSPGSP